MTNVADLVKAVKDRKEFELFDKIRFICETLGKRLPSESPSINAYEYIPGCDDLKLVLVKVEFDEEVAQDVIVNDTKGNIFFDYFNHDIPVKKGRVGRYIPGRWENLVEDHYKMSLDNI